MNIITTEIEGLLIIEPRIFQDSRGYFFESFNQREFEEKIGLHFQKGAHSQSKLVRVVKGKVLDVAVDLRPGSKTFGKHVSVELSEDNHRQFFIPKGFAHGFSVLSDEVIFQYKCDSLYCPESEGAVAWDDPDLEIDWMVPKDKIILSEKDKRHPKLRDCRPEDLP